MRLIIHRLISLAEGGRWCTRGRPGGLSGPQGCQGPTTIPPYAVIAALVGIGGGGVEGPIGDPGSLMGVRHCTSSLNNNRGL